MGQVCSGAGVSKHVCVPRDPADKELDPIELRETKIPDFDAFFESAFAPLNELVDIHNGLALSEENLKAAAAALQGEAQLRMLVIQGSVALELFRFEQVDEETFDEVLVAGKELDDKLAASVALREAFDAVQHAISELNVALLKPEAAGGNAVQFEPKLGRLLVTRRGEGDVLVRDVNVALFTLRKHLMLQAHVASLREAAAILFQAVAKSEDLSQLSVAVDEDSGAPTLMNGDEPLELKRLNKLARPVAQLRDAMVELVENVQSAAQSVPELAQASADFAEQAQGFPTQVPSAVSDAGLSITELPKAASATGGNAKALGNGPKIARATLAMVQYAARELIEASQMPRGG